MNGVREFECRLHLRVQPNPEREFYIHFYDVGLEKKEGKTKEKVDCSEFSLIPVGTDERGKPMYRIISKKRIVPSQLEAFLDKFHPSQIAVMDLGKYSDELEYLCSLGVEIAKDLITSIVRQTLQELTFEELKLLKRKWERKPIRNKTEEFYFKILREEWKKAMRERIYETVAQKRVPDSDNFIAYITEDGDIKVEKKQGNLTDYWEN